MADPSSRRQGLPIGTPAPWFFGRTAQRARFAFDSVAGRNVVLCFLGSAASARGSALLAAFERVRASFDDVHASFFGVTQDASDESSGRLPSKLPGMRHFFDTDGAIAALYETGDAALTYVLDPMLRIVAVLPCQDDAQAHVARVMQMLARLPVAHTPVAAQAQAPVLVLPRVFEPALCKTLIAHYEQTGSRSSGFMQEIDGKTVAVQDASFKRRRDCLVQDEALQRQCLARISTRLAPEIKKAMQFEAQRLERHLVSCYDENERGHFAAHRDNTTRGTAHRRFAVSLFLNSDEYEGGQLRFPEFGPALYSAPTGGAVVFSCALLHEATPVTRGRRYMYLPFLYDEAAARQRRDNLQYLDEASLEAPRKAPRDGRHTA